LFAFFGVPLIGDRKLTVVETRIAALLCTTPNQRVPCNRLAQAIWSGRKPKDPLNNIRVHISHLRGYMKKAGLDPRRLRHESVGYRLEIDPDLVDVHAFTRTVRRCLSQAGDSKSTVSPLREALGRWTGTPLLGLDEPSVHAWREEAEVCWTRAVTYLTERLIEMGRHDEARLRLSALSLDLLNEEHVRLLMLIHLGQHRRRDALELYGRARVELVNNLGLEPCAALQDLQHVALTESQSHSN